MNGASMTTAAALPVKGVPLVNASTMANFGGGGRGGGDGGGEGPGDAMFQALAGGDMSVHEGQISRA